MWWSGARQGKAGQGRAGWVGFCSIFYRIGTEGQTEERTTVRGGQKAHQNDRNIRVHALTHHSKHMVQAQISEHVRAVSNEISVLVHVCVVPTPGDGGTVALLSKRCALVTLESYIVSQKPIIPGWDSGVVAVAVCSYDRSGCLGRGVVPPGHITPRGRVGGRGQQILWCVVTPGRIPRARRGLVWSGLVGPGWIGGVVAVAVSS